MSTFFQDLRFAFRMLGKSPVFTIVAVVTLALGIGANTAIFSAVQAVLLNPPPYDDPERLLVVESNIADGNVRAWSYPLFEDFRQRVSPDLKVAAYTNYTRGYSLSGTDAPRPVQVEFVSAAYFPILGIDAVQGRTFVPEEDATPSSHPVALISHALWNSSLGGKEGVVGSSIRLNTIPLTVVGVLPPSFAGLSGQADIWVPMMMSPKLQFARRLSVSFAFWHNVIARPPRDWTPERLRAALQSASLGVSEKFKIPEVFKGGPMDAVAIPLSKTRIDPSLRSPLLILSGAVVFVLLIACVNLANLLMGRSHSRKREFTMRSALGAGRGRLLRQLLTESLLLSLLGGLLALAVAGGAVALVSALRPPTAVGTAGLGSLGVSSAVLFFNFALASAATLIFGWIPAWRSSRPDLAADFKGAGWDGSSNARRVGARSILVVSEVALAVVLLVGAGLLLRTFFALQSQPLGFNPEGVLTVQIQLPNQAYDDTRARTFFSDLSARVAALPLVRSAAVANCLPVHGGCDRTSMRLEAPLRQDGSSAGGGAGAPPRSASPEESGRRNQVWVQMTDEHYLGTMGIQLQAGRNLSSGDRQGTPWVALVNEAAARTFWPGGDPLGSRVRPAIGLPEGAFAEVVGIVADVRENDLESEATPGVYLSYRQLTYGSNYLVLRTSGSPESLVPEVREEVRRLDPGLPLWDVRTMEGHLSRAVAPARFSMTLLGLFAGLALTLAAVGIYGVMSHGVSVRRAEFAIRRALGAGRGNVLGLVLGRGIVLAAIGIALGIGGAAALTRLMSGLLFGVTPLDPLTLASAAGVLGVVALLACTLPAYRATLADPVRTLRSQ